MAQQPSALRVVQATGLQGNNYNPQGGNYNPQKTAPSPQKTVNPQKTAPARVVQPAAAPVPNAAAVVAAAAAQQRAVIEAAARQREIVRAQVQGQVDLKVATNKASLNLAVAPARERAKFVGMGKVKQPEIIDSRSDYDKVRDSAYWRTRRLVDGIKQGGGGFLDAVTFGSDRRGQSARKFAEDQLNTVVGRMVDDYSKRLENFIAEQARRKAAIENAKFLDAGAMQRAISEYELWEQMQVGDFENSRAEIEGIKNAYTEEAGREIDAPLANAGKFFNQITKPIQDTFGKVWQYTLGSGDENAPSIVTAPSRAINAVGNFLDPNRTIHKSDGTSGQLDKSKNAWQNTFGQRNLNMRPESTYRMSFDDWMNTKRTVDSDGKSMTYREWVDSMSGSTKDKQQQKLKALYDGENRSNEAANNVAEFFADPLTALGWGAKVATKSGGFLSKTLESAKSSKIGQSFINTGTKIAESKPVKWLASESKTPQQNLYDAIEAAKTARGSAQAQLLPRIAELHKQVTGRTDLDYSVFDDLAKLTDDEAKLLQRMTNGKLGEAKWFQRGAFRNPELKTKLESIAARYKKFTDEMAKADKITPSGSRFLGDSPRQYYADTSWLPKGAKGLDEYNFKLFKKKDRVQSARDLSQSQVDRLFKSDVEQYFAKNATKSQKASKAELQELTKKYDDTVGVSRAAVEEAYKKTRTLYGRTRGFLDKYGPTALWKKSVLKYRPAWYVNNFLYNTQAAGLAGGGRALLEQAKLMRPKNFRAAMAEVPEGVKTALAKEIGKGKIAKFGNNIENLSRLAAWRALKAKGLTDKQALKRINRYLIDYKTRNIERPLKAVAPFYSFQKGIAKAAIQMPFDRPLAAKAYNELDQFQQEQFNNDFDSVVPALKEKGYSDEEIEQMRQEQAKYFKGRLKVGDNYITTPFNAFSEKGLSNLGLNPYASALAEYGTSKDSFDRPVSGSDSSFISRLTTKFPQADLAKKAASNPTKVEKWIGKTGSEGYGLPKEKFSQKTDKLGADLAAFFGAPRGMKFDTEKFLERKGMQKLVDEYFKTDWKSMDFPAQEKKRGELFAKYGVTAEEFYEGELAKYDNPTAKKIKDLKKEAKEKTHKLFEEYFAQPSGTRNVWATNKLRELNKTGYFDKNPFLKSFDWTNPTTIKNAGKQMAYQEAKRTGNWKSYNAKYGMTEKAKNAAFWQKYYSTSDPAGRRQLLRENSQYASRGVKSEAEVAEGKFWAQYVTASKDRRRDLLKENPQYNRRSAWSQKMWDEWKANQKATERTKLAKVDKFSSFLAVELAKNRAKAAPVISKRTSPKFKKLAFTLR